MNLKKPRNGLHCAIWAKDKNGLPYPKKGYNGTDIHPANQAYKEQSDINAIVEKAKRTGVLAHINNNAQFYADMTDFDYEGAMNQIAQTNSAFYELSAELRSEFDNDPGKFRNTVAPMTAEEVAQKFPELAKPGKQFPNVMGGKTPPVPPKKEAPPPDKEGTEEPKNEETKEPAP